MVSISPNRLIEAVRAFTTAKVLVVGDVMLDHYIFGDSRRISPEAPVPVVRVERDVYHPGGAANVAKNITALGGRAFLSGIIGRDEPGTILKELLSQSNISWMGHEDPVRPTCQKIRVLARGQQLLRIDREDPSMIGKGGESSLALRIKTEMDRISCIVVSDYAKGLMVPGVMALLKDVAREQAVPLIVDPKPVNADLYEGVDLITPNRQEAEEMAALYTKDQMDLEGIMTAIKDALGLGSLVVTLGQKGMAISRDSHTFYLPTMAREVFDVTGAGDTVIAILALGLSVGLDLEEAGCLANIGAGLVVAKIGTATISEVELMEGVNRAFE